ncbi:TniB family NTP-binding protein [Bosea sp. UC22_33]|uniref:TniB family NTP-binding protein n=1 Tax=Bosea sp. UC22_33 TaxID=3350165 RepID=UPI00366B9DD2
MTEHHSIRRSHLASNGEPLDRAERFRRLTRMLINHPKAESVHRSIEMFLDRSADSRSGVNYLVCGPSRVGKSTLSYAIYQSLLQKEADSLKRPLRGKYIELEDRDIRPVLWVEAKADTTTVALLEKLLEELGDPSPSAGKIPEKERRLSKHLFQQGVKAVIIDEVQHFAQHRTAKFQYKLADWLKSNLQNIKHNSSENGNGLEESFCHIIFFGTDESRVLLQQNEQLKGRNIGGHNYTPYNWEIDEERESYLDVLSSIDSSIPFAESSDLDEYHRALKINEAADGSMGLTMKLIQAAGIMAIRDESDRILDIHLRDGFDELEAVIGLKDNPWRIDDEPGSSRKKAAIRPNRSTTLKGKGPSTEPSFHKK